MSPASRPGRRPAAGCTTILLLALAAAAAAAACGGRPGDDGLRDSFARQLAANRFVRDFQRNGDEFTFTAPGAEGGTAKWRVRIDSAVVEPNDAAANAAAQPYKGTVKSSWWSDGEIVLPSAGESNLPIELLSNGISQDCWAFWEEASQSWSWE